MDDDDGGDDDHDDNNDNHIFAGTKIISVVSKLPGTFHRLHDPAIQKARPLARTKGHTDNGPNNDGNDDDDDDDVVDDEDADVFFCFVFAHTA